MQANRTVSWLDSAVQKANCTVPERLIVSLTWFSYR